MTKLQTILQYTAFNNTELIIIIFLSKKYVLPPIKGLAKGLNHCVKVYTVHCLHSFKFNSFSNGGCVRNRLINSKKKGWLRQHLGHLQYMNCLSMVQICNQSRLWQILIAELGTHVKGRDNIIPF